MHIYSAILIRTLEYFNWNKIKHDPTFSLTFSVSLQNCYMVSHKVHLNMNFTDLSQCPSLYLPLWDIKFMNVVLSGRSEYILPLLSIPHFIISQCHAYWFFHILVLHIIISSTSLPSGELFCCILHMFIPIKLLLLLEEKTLQQRTRTVGESLWPTKYTVFSWSTFSIESQKQMFKHHHAKSSFIISQKKEKKLCYNISWWILCWCSLKLIFHHK